MKGLLEEKTIVKAGFFYKGRGFTVTDAAAISGLLGAFDKTMVEFKEQVALTGTKFYFDQLDELNTLTDQQMMGPEENVMSPGLIMWCMNIYQLTECGHLTNDDNNGLLFMHE